MGCGGFEEKLSAYLDGELAPGEKKTVEEHLQGCADCARLLEDMRRVDALGRALQVPAARAEDWQRCREEVARRIGDGASAGQTRARRMSSRARAAVLSLAGAAAAALVAAVLARPGAPPRGSSLPPAGESVCVLDYDDTRYTLSIEENPRYTIIKLISAGTHEGG